MSHESLINYQIGNAYMLFQRDRGFINNLTYSDLEDMLPYEREGFMLHMKRLIEEKVKEDSKGH